MKELLLGLRLLFRSGRGNRVRFALMTLGSSIGVCCLAVVLTIPGILAAQDGRITARQPTSPDYYAVSDPVGYPLALERADSYGSKPLTRTFLARGSRAVPPPPGLKALPDRGQVFVSPALREVLRKEPELARRLPGREAGLIGPQGLARPDELLAYVGMTRNDLRTGYHFTGFGKEAPLPTLDPSAVDNLRCAMGFIVLLPLALYLSVCARLSGAERARRLAALRLLGMSIKEVQRVSAAETVAAAAIGAVVGLGEYWVLNQIGARVGLPGFTWYPDDGALSGSTLVACLVGCPALAWFVGRTGARNAAANPLAVRRAAVAKAPSSWGFLPLLAGSGIATGYCVAGATGHVPAGSLPTVLIPSSVALIGVGLVAALPPLCRLLARRVARSTRSLALGLAMRRNEAEPGGVLRVTAGLVLLVYVASLAQGTIVQMNESARPVSPVMTIDVPTKGLSAAQERSLVGLPGTDTHVVTVPSDRLGALEGPGAPEDVSSPGLVLATCAQLRDVVSLVGGCVDGQPLRLRNPDLTESEMPYPKGKVFLPLAGGRRGPTFTPPRKTVWFHDSSVLGAVDSGSILIPPSMVPSGARPEGATLKLVSASDPETVGRVLDGISRVSPIADPTPVGLNVDALQETAIVETLLGVAMVLGLVIAVAAFLVAAADRAVERRPQVTALSLLGARRSTLRAVQVTQVLLPLGVGLVLALAVGRMAESGYLVYCQGATFWDGAGLPVLLAGTLGVMVVAALGALPLVGRRIDPELIRRD
ncbi:ABC transporter permease [Streptomyces sp. NPDC047061]|uniref:ABC transporter permease n=1 Tax=Streptomyces sp. NPDC047061 TaxID=3154605 RepID=UPI003403E27D